MNDVPRLPLTDTFALYWVPYREVEHLPTHWLNPGELQRASRFKVEFARQQFIFYRCALRQLLGQILDLAPPAVPLDVGPYGKPELSSTQSSPACEFNLSHTTNCGLIGISSSVPLGVDVEYLEPNTDYQSLAALVLHPQEEKTVQMLTKAEQTRALLRSWTMKEAVLKAAGVGWAISPAKIELPAETSDVIVQLPSVTELANVSLEHATWRVRFWQPQADTFAAVATHAELTVPKVVEFKYSFP